jgi:outer membrane lipoprotein SlyB
MSSKPEIFSENDTVSYAAVSGKRGLSAKATGKLALAGAAIFMAAAIAPGAAHAQSWYASANTSANVYDTQSALQSQNVETGTIIGIRPVTLRQNTSYNGGTMIGGIVGAAVGVGIAQNTRSFAARSLATAIGGIGGAAIGTRIANGNSVRQAIQVFVRNDRTRQTVAVVEDNDQPGMVVGAEVAMVRSRQGYAITPMNMPRTEPQQVAYGQQPQVRQVVYAGQPGVVYTSAAPQQQVEYVQDPNQTPVQTVIRRSYP